jgi:DNA-binding PadR family transcriptional regulator
MPKPHRANPLALAVLVSLLEEPMHPYEIASRLRARKKHESVRLNYGSLYAVVDALTRRGMIAPQQTQRAGRLPERTVYALTDTGRTEVQQWLAELVSTPVKEYTAFEAALSFLPALPPAEARALLEERAQTLELEAAAGRGQRRLMDERHFPRLFLIESEFRACLRDAELDYVQSLIADIDAGRLEGLDVWQRVHRGDGAFAATDPGPASN